eukprot:CAMPEP_0175899522 /NCGR_PEP_ID=MMETSP0108-20121206/1846_1 /TAXON_ID=195067 ORGANISM="Goniomonas pacifica, Strain CCMP1869" /NCGR_SAMPLE_ID=MMETSP0108 /ASSEMBLY_ACC=CAM_ASM_000204 /LENGTH=36 /DNA_ID= /DNA_START= /DNA_END= /DNA_ORIENTATION=
MEPGGAVEVVCDITPWEQLLRRSAVDLGDNISRGDL